MIWFSSSAHRLYNPSKYLVFDSSVSFAYPFMILTRQICFSEHNMVHAHPAAPARDFPNSLWASVGKVNDSSSPLNPSNVLPGASPSSRRVPCSASVATGRQRRRQRRSGGDSRDGGGGVYWRRSPVAGCDGWGGFAVPPSPFVCHQDAWRGRPSLITRADRNATPAKATRRLIGVRACLSRSPTGAGLVITHSGPFPGVRFRGAF